MRPDEEGIACAFCSKRHSTNHLLRNHIRWRHFRCTLCSTPGKPRKALEEFLAHCATVHSLGWVQIPNSDVVLATTSAVVQDPTLHPPHAMDATPMHWLPEQQPAALRSLSPTAKEPKPLLPLPLNGRREEPPAADGTEPTAVPLPHSGEAAPELDTRPEADCVVGAPRRGAQPEHHAPWAGDTAPAALATSLPPLHSRTGPSPFLSQPQGGMDDRVENDIPALATFQRCSIDASVDTPNREAHGILKHRRHSGHKHEESDHLHPPALQATHKREGLNPLRLLGKSVDFSTAGDVVITAPQEAAGRRSEDNTESRRWSTHSIGSIEAAAANAAMTHSSNPLGYPDVTRHCCRRINGQHHPCCDQKQRAGVSMVGNPVAAPNLDIADGKTEPGAASMATAAVLGRSPTMEITSSPGKRSNASFSPSNDDYSIECDFNGQTVLGRIPSKPKLPEFNTSTYSARALSDWRKAASIYGASILPVPLALLLCLHRSERTPTTSFWMKAVAVRVLATYWAVVLAVIVFSKWGAEVTAEGRSQQRAAIVTIITYLLATHFDALYYGRSPGAPAPSTRPNGIHAAHLLTRLNTTVDPLPVYPSRLVAMVLASLTSGVVSFMWLRGSDYGDGDIYVVSSLVCSVISLASVVAKYFRSVFRIRHASKRIDAYVTITFDKDAVRQRPVDLTCWIAVLQFALADMEIVWRKAASLLSWGFFLLIVSGMFSVTAPRLQYRLGKEGNNTHTQEDMRLHESVEWCEVCVVWEYMVGYAILVVCVGGCIVAISHYLTALREDCALFPAFLENFCHEACEIQAQHLVPMWRSRRSIFPQTPPSTLTIAGLILLVLVNVVMYTLHLIFDFGD